MKRGGKIQIFKRRYFILKGLLFLLFLVLVLVLVLVLGLS